MRLAYLDEAGISKGEPGLAVAGVLVHGDTEVLEVERRLDALVMKYIPETDRLGFVFHATDIFHGSDYWDRKKWPLDTRLQILSDIASIIEDLHLPVVNSMYMKDDFGAGEPEVVNAEHGHKRMVMQTASAGDCAIWADRWLEKYASNENAMIIAEDTDRVKRMMKMAVKVFRTPTLLKIYGLDRLPGLPLRRIVDTVFFAAKQECAALQLADLCAFTFARILKDKSVPLNVARILLVHNRWILQFKPHIKMPEVSELIADASLVEQSSET